MINFIFLSDSISFKPFKKNVILQGKLNMKSKILFLSLRLSFIIPLKSCTPP